MSLTGWMRSMATGRYVSTRIDGCSYIKRPAYSMTPTLWTVAELVGWEWREILNALVCHVVTQKDALTRHI